MNIKIAAFSGSVRKESFTTRLLIAFQQAAPKGIVMEIIPVGQLPFINQDLEKNLPVAVKDLHKAIRRADAFLFATPEYNRSYSPVIKNAIDWGSRPEGHNGWDKKPAAVIGCSPYQLGAFGAVNHLRQVLLYVNTYIMQQPEFYLPEVLKVMDDEGKITDKETKQHIKEFWKVYSGWIKNFVHQ